MTTIFPDEMPKLPTRITVQVYTSDFGPTNTRHFGVTFRCLVGKEVTLTFRAGGGNRDTLIASFQATLPTDFNVLTPREQMCILSDQVANVSTDYYCRDTGEVAFLDPNNFQRLAVYGNTIDC